jgi:hypothetical protein
LEGTTVFRELLKKDREIVDKLRFSGDKVVDGKLVRGEIAQHLLTTLGTADPLGKTENGVRILGTATLALALKYMADNGIAIGPGEEYMYLSGGADFEKQEKLGAFKARNLAGIAFTGPFLHNGSVRTLRDLLTPPSQRPVFFHVGSTEFDDVNIGFADKGADFHANKPGNLATGHAYGTDLEEDEKEALLQYLKSI